MPLTKKITKAFFMGVIILFIFSIVNTVMGQFSTRHTSEKQVLEAYSVQPLSFEANKGQTDRQVKFLSRGRGYSLFLTPTEAVLVLSKSDAPTSQHKAYDIQEKVTDKSRNDFVGAVLRMKLIGANPSPQVNGIDELPGKINYFTGNDPKKWQTNIRTYARVEYRDVYPGVNLVYYGNQNQLEYDLVISPGSDPDIIKISFEGAKKLHIDSKGDLVLETAVGEIRQRKPHIYQEVNGIKQEISGNYILIGKHQVGFQIAAYDANRPLVIDPELRYVSYLGGSDLDVALDITLDPLGNAYYVTGYTNSTNFPALIWPRPYQERNAGLTDVFVAKFNASNNALIYSTYIGGSHNEIGFGIAVDSTGNAYVTGSTGSTDFPSRFRTTTCNLFPLSYGGDVFIIKLWSKTGYMDWSTCIGGTDFDRGSAIAIDLSGNVYVAGYTSSVPFPIVNAFQASYGGGPHDAFVMKLNATGTRIIYSTYLGGSGDDGAYGLSLDSSDNAYVIGSTGSTNFPIAGAFQSASGGDLDAFVTMFNTIGSVVYSTYLGGSGRDEGWDIAVNQSGNAYVTGATNSLNFPTVRAFQSNIGGSYDAFVSKLIPSGSGLVYSTYLDLGQNNYDGGYAIAIDPSGNAYVTGETFVYAFPGGHPLEPTPAPCAPSWYKGLDIFFAKFNVMGSLVYRDVFGGCSNEGGNAIAVDLLGKAYVTGYTISDDIVTNRPEAPFQSNNGGRYDAFIAKWAEPPTSGGNGGCLLKTAFNESSDQRDLNTLRQFRDEVLLTNSAGTLLVNAYYNASPYLSNLINGNEILRKAVRVVIKPLVVLLKIILDFPKEMKSFLLFLPVMIGIIVVRRKLSH